MKGFITNLKDRANLLFLLSAPPEAYKKWASTCTHDDLVYAEELLAAYTEEIKFYEFDDCVESKLEMMDGQFDECREVLRKFHVN
jgi:hypothetical protein